MITRLVLLNAKNGKAKSANVKRTDASSTKIPRSVRDVGTRLGHKLLYKYNRDININK